MKKLSTENLKSDTEISETINVIVGFNGSGKTRLLNKIDSLKDYKSRMISGDSSIFFEHYPEVLTELNLYFESTGKRLFLKEGFLLHYEYLNETFYINTLSSNELYLIFLMYEVAHYKSLYYDILLIDEIEKGLCLDWQEDLLESFTKLAPNTQFFITTHSPAILMDGQLNTFINMKDLQGFLNEN